MSDRFQAVFFAIVDSQDKLTPLFDIMKAHTQVFSKTPKVMTKHEDQSGTTWYYVKGQDGYSWWLADDDMRDYRKMMKKCVEFLGTDGAVIIGFNDSESSRREHIASTPKGKTLHYDTSDKIDYDPGDDLFDYALDNIPYGYDKFEKAFIKAYGDTGKEMLQIYREYGISVDTVKPAVQAQVTPIEPKPMKSNPDFIIEDGTMKSYRGKASSVVIPQGVTRIDETAFYDLANLAEVRVPEGVTSIGHNAFSRCKRLSRVYLPASLTEIDDAKWLFYQCENMSHVEVTEGNPCFSSKSGALYSADGTTLYYCPSASTGTFRIPEGVTTISDWACSDCKALQNIEIPSTVTAIGEDAFYGCEKLKRIELPEKMSTIENSLGFAK